MWDGRFLGAVDWVRLGLEFVLMLKDGILR